MDVSYVRSVPFARDSKDRAQEDGAGSLSVKCAQE